MFSKIGLERLESMDYKINDICTNLSIGKSTIYDRLKELKKSIPESDWKRNEYFYYTDNNKLFITSKGYDFIKDYSKSFKHNSSFNDDISSIYQNQIIEFYKKENEYLKQENQRLLDIISVKEQKEIARDMKYLQNSENNQNISFFDKFFMKFKK